MKTITISFDKISVSAELYDTPTARQILTVLPLEGIVHVWGEEIYFEIPLKMNLETNAKTDVEVGALGYWPIGPAFCIFFGPTPVSTGNKPRAYSPVNIFGHIIDNPSLLKTIQEGSKIRVH
ncbi:MAG: hypothetical protein E3K32_00160 [wastewater metagenome]|nr:hypothetical protein [Candidatus Loosdrechtia aerotolerans]